MEEFFIKTNKVFQHDKKQLINSFYKTKNPYIFFKEYYKLLCNLLITLFNFFINNKNLVIIAIGGFGRKEIYPYSDIDFIITYENNIKVNEKLNNDITKFIQIIWDFKLKPSVQIGNIEELLHLSKNDTDFNTALLDASFIYGNKKLFNTLTLESKKQRDLFVFIEQKKIEIHNLITNNFYIYSELEPDLKKILREIHIIFWTIKAINNNNFRNLIDRNIISSKEYKTLVKEHRNIALYRISLHLVAKKYIDKLLFNYQVEVSKIMGFNDVFLNTNLEKLMKKLYSSIKKIKQISNIFFSILCEEIYNEYPRTIKQINKNYYSINNKIVAKDKGIFFKKQNEIFNLLKLFQENDNIKYIEPNTLKSWWYATRKINYNEFRNHKTNQRYFINLFKHTNKLPTILEILNLYDVLSIYIKDFANICNLLQFDLFHIYTVDLHSIMVVYYLYLLDGKDIQSNLSPYAKKIFSNYKYKYIVYLAGLLHDIGKGRNADHEKTGQKLVGNFIKQHNLPTFDANLLSWLIGNHLLMSNTAQKKDLENINVIIEFANQVDNITKLDALYVLTVCDMLGANPKIWNNWKDTLLITLYEKTLQFLNKNKKSYVKKDIYQQKIKFFTNIFNQENKNFNFNDLINNFGEDYFYRFSKDEIKKHYHLIDSIYLNNFNLIALNNNIIELNIYTKNKKYLFANIATIVAKNNLDILKASAFITKHNFIIDNFIISIPSFFHEKEKEILFIKLKEELNIIVAKQKLEIPQYISYEHIDRRNKYYPFVPVISISKDKNSNKRYQYILNITAKNRKKILANIAIILGSNNINIINASINTLDQKIDDSFVIYSKELENEKFQKNLIKNITEISTY